MRNMQSIVVTLLLALAMLAMVAVRVSAMPAISVVASVRGKKHDVSEVETVDEFLHKVEGLAGLEAGQSSVLFRGKVLSGADKLEEVGVATGDVLMVVKGRKLRPAKADLDGDGDDGAASPSATSVSSGLPPGLEGAMSSDAYKKAMGDVNPEEMQKAMKAMDNLLDSNFVEEYFADDDRLETARQQMLANADQYEQMMPGFKEQALAIASDPVKWREAMLQAKDQITKLKAQRDLLRSSKGQSPAGAASSEQDE